MADALLDTTVFIDYWRGDTGAQRVIDSVSNNRSTGSVSAMSAVELWQYSGLSRREEIEYQALLMFLEEVPVTNAVGAVVGVEIRAFSRAQRRRLLGDAIIGVSARLRGEPVCTRNQRDIRRFNPNVMIY